MNYIIGIMAMMFGFIAIFIDNFGGAFACFFFAFILWCFLAYDEYIEYRKKKKGGDKQ